MRWYHYVALFFAGAFLANTVPHFVQGISGRSFPTPFASPPGQGESSPLVNVLWGSFNVIVGYVLCRTGGFSIRRTRDAVIVGAGVILMGILLANAFGPLYSK
jgi:hypothetical protein